MRFSSVIYLLQEGYLNIRRNGLMTIAALGVVAVTLTILGASLWSVFRINEIAQMQPETFNEVDVFVNEDMERDDVLALQPRLAAMPNVARVTFVPREQAWKELTNDEKALTAAMPEDPLPDAFRIEMRQAKYVAELAQTLRDKKAFPEVEHVTDAGAEVRLMLAFARLIKVIGFGVATALFIATMFIVYNTIRLTVFARRREIRIMQLVGATSWFIRLPLLIEGLFHGVAGALLAAVVVSIGARQVGGFVDQIHSPLIPNIPSRATPVTMTLLLVVIGAFVGIAGSNMSIRKYLKQI
jgi:cell division transport system permease protein